MSIVDYLTGQPSDRFIDDNFGSSLRCLNASPLPASLADAIAPLYLAPEELRVKHHRTRQPGEQYVSDRQLLLNALAGNRNSYGLAQLSADSAPRIELTKNFAEAFALFIGDTFADRLAFWNFRSNFPAHYGREFVTLIVSEGLLLDQPFFDALVQFLRNRNGVHGSNGPCKVNLCSVSLSSQRLGELCEKFRRSDNWTNYHAHRLDLTDCVPEFYSAQQHLGLVTGGPFDRRPTWKEFAADGQNARPPTVLPLPLQSVQAASAATSGCWAMDLDIERQNNLTHFANVRHHWRLPRRLRMHGAFQKPYEGPDNRQYRIPRTSREGYLTVFTAFGENPPTIALPDDETAFRYALEKGIDWPPATRLGFWAAPGGLTRACDRQIKGVI